MSASGWDALQWVAWLRRGPTDPAPSWQGLRDCADALQEEVESLRAQLAVRVSGGQVEAGQ